MRKKRDHGDKDPSKIGSNNADGDNISMFSSKNLASDKDREEIEVLRTQVEDLQMKLSEKDELLKSAEISKNQMNSIHAKLDELKHQAMEKDSLIKSTQQQLSDTKVLTDQFCCFVWHFNMLMFSYIEFQLVVIT